MLKSVEHLTLLSVPCTSPATIPAQEIQCTQNQASFSIIVCHMSLQSSAVSEKSELKCSSHAQCDAVLY